MTRRESGGGRRPGRPVPGAPTPAASAPAPSPPAPGPPGAANAAPTGVTPGATPDARDPIGTVAAAAADVAPVLPAGPAVSDRVFTVPNVLSMLRLLGVPVFLWLLLGPEADGWAIALLAVSGATDYVDGQIARRYGSISRVGQLLDPLADRLYILTTVLAFTIRDVLPLYFTLILLARDLFLAGLLPVLKRHGYGPLPVHFMGKAATYNLLCSFPLVLLGAGDGVAADVGRAIGWGFATWGVILYWWAGLLYAWQVRLLVRSGSGGGKPPGSPAGRDAEGALA